MRTLDISSNALTALPSELANLTALQTLSINHNSISGALPNRFTLLTALTTLSLHNNAFDRDANHDARIPAALTSRFAGIATKNIADQSDVQAPVLSNPQQLYVVPIAPFTYTVSINENAYAVA